VRRGVDAQFGGSLFFATDVNLRGGIFTNAHECQPGLHPARLERGNPCSEFALDLRGNGATINEIAGRHWPA
jgi:hypothetical protein